MHFCVEHMISGVDITAFEKLFFAENFNIALCEHLQMYRQLQDLQENNGVLTRAVRVTPQRAVPAILRKVLKNQPLTYTEFIEYRHGSLQGTYRIETMLLSDKISSAGLFAFEPRAQGILRRVAGDVVVNIFGVGSLIERFVVADVEQSYALAAAFTQTWIDTKL